MNVLSSFIHPYAVMMHLYMLYLNDFKSYGSGIILLLDHFNLFCTEESHTGLEQVIGDKNVLSMQSRAESLTEVAFMRVWIKKVKLTWAVTLKSPLKECFLLCIEGTKKQVRE